MDKSEIKAALLSLSEEERRALIEEVEKGQEDTPSLTDKRRHQFANKIVTCPYCSSKKYRKHGKDKGSQRYYCNSCKRTFTEYTGTWLAGIHKKDFVSQYLKLMEQELSLDKIKERLKINKKTALDWRHKILSSLKETDNSKFKGITESDETFFLNSSKGIKINTRESRKRGGKGESKGISKHQVAVIVTTDRNAEMDLSVAKLGRLRKADIEKAIGRRISKETILCSDGHVSYKGFAMDNEIEHHPIRADLKEFVKGSLYHIQHVNSIDSRLKGWIDHQFLGVSTKYLQNYLNWFKAKEKLKQSKVFLRDFTNKSFQDTNSLNRYRMINNTYNELINYTTQN